MRLRKSGLVLLLAAFTFTVATVLVTHSQQPDPKSAARKDATPVTEGLMTAKQIEHSKLYTQSGRKKKISNAPDGSTIIIGLPWGDESGANRLSFSDYLREMTCKADAVLIGTVKNKASQLTTDATFVFTDYELTVEDAVKNNPSYYVQSKSEITVTRPGGVIDLNGKIISVKDKSFKPLEVGKSYLLFLTYIPSTGAYRSTGSQGSFEISGNQLVRLTDEHPSYMEAQQQDQVSVINVIRASSGVGRGTCSCWKDVRNRKKLSCEKPAGSRPELAGFPFESKSLSAGGSTPISIARLKNARERSTRS